MAKYKLDDVCEFITDGTHQTPEYCDEGGVIFLSSKDVTERKINWDDVKHISNSLHEKLYKRLSPRKDDILLAKNGTTGVAAIVDKNEIFDVYVSLAVLRPLTTINPKYLLYAINSPVAKRQFDAGLKGVGVPNLHLNVIRETVINVVDKEEQEKICVVLDKIAGVIDKRKAELNELDNLIKARFVELTDETETVPTRMGDIATYLNGYAFKPTQWEEIGLPIIRIQNLNDENASYNYFSGSLADKYFVQNGDVLVSWATHLEAYIWKGQDAWLNQHIFKVVFDKMEVDKIYFVYACEEALRQAFRNAHGFKPTMEHIKKADFDNAIVQLPKIEVQEQFAAFVTQVDKSKLYKIRLILSNMIQASFLRTNANF